MTALLYHCPDARSFRPLWAMEELGTPYTLRMLPFPPRLTSPDYLTENPLGTIPLFVDGEVRMRESTMIGHYLAVKAGSDLTLSPGEPDYPRYLDMLTYGETTLSWPQGVILYYGRFIPEADRLPRVAADMRARMATMFADLDRQLGERAWIAGERFTMADVSIGYALKLSRYTDTFDGLSERLKSYHQRLAARPAYKRAEAAQKAG